MQQLPMFLVPVYSFSKYSFIETLRKLPTETGLPIFSDLILFISLPCDLPLHTQTQAEFILRHSCQLFPASAKSLKLHHVNEMETVGRIQVLLFHISKEGRTFCKQELHL